MNKPLEDDAADAKTDEEKKNFLVDLSTFGKTLLAAESRQGYLSCLSSLLALGPSAIDLEVTSLAPENGGTPELMLQFLLMLLAAVKERAHYEATQV